MHIPMEFLSQVTTRTDSGRGGTASRSSPGKTDARFGKVFEKELNRHDQKLLNKSKGPPGPKGYTEKPKPVDGAEQTTVNNKKDEQIEDKEGFAAAAGAMGNQLQEQGVVIILEGEESVATPSMRVEDPAIPPQQPQADEPEIQPQSTEEANTAKNGLPKEMETHAPTTETAQFKEVLAAKTEATPQTNNTNVAGEVTARTPEIMSEDGKSNGQADNNLKDDGNPSPLENRNENTNAQAAGTEQEDQTYLNAADAVKTKAKSESTDSNKPTENTAPNTIEAPPPLSESIKPEQFRATEQMSKAALEHPVKPENLFQEMISRVETMQNESKSTMTIQLNPEHLGKVALEVAVDTSGVHVKIKAEDSGVRNMINTQISTLIESLQSKGLAVSEVEVVFAGANFDSFQEQSNGQRESENHNRAGKQGKNAASTIEYYTTITDLMDYYLDAGISSVEYRA